LLPDFVVTSLRYAAGRYGVTLFCRHVVTTTEKKAAAENPKKLQKNLE